MMNVMTRKQTNWYWGICVNPIHLVLVVMLVKSQAQSALQCIAIMLMFILFEIISYDVSPLISTQVIKKVIELIHSPV